MRQLVLFFALLIPALGHAQTYSIDWYRFSSGAGASVGTNGSTVYTLNSTFGQADAATAITGGNFALTGGFWSVLALVQIPGGPRLSITNAADVVTVSWPAPSYGFSLETSSSLSAPNWSVYQGIVTTNGTTNSVNIRRPAGNLFFRLAP